MEFEASLLEEIEVALWMNFHYERDLNLTAARLTYIDYHETFFFLRRINRNLDFPISVPNYSLSVESVNFHIYLT